MNEKKHSKLTSKNLSQESLAKVKEELDIKKLKRKYFIEKVNDYSTVITTKVVGVGSLVIGVSELVVLNLLSLVLAPPTTPFALIGVGLAFLLNKRAISIMREILKILAQYDEEDIS